MEEQEQALDMERRRLSELQIERKNFINWQLIGYGMEELYGLEGENVIFCWDRIIVFPWNNST